MLTHFISLVLTYFISLPMLNHLNVEIHLVRRDTLGTHARCCFGMFGYGVLGVLVLVTVRLHPYLAQKQNDCKKIASNKTANLL
jgi:hypothetical protein